MRWWVLVAALVFAGPAEAGEITQSLARGGDWAAVAQRAPGAPVACIAIDPVVRLALRADADGAWLMVQNRHWDLPANRAGTIRIALGGQMLSFPITGYLNDNNTASARLGPADLAALLVAMRQAASMRVVVGQTRPLTVSLADSGAVLDAFRHCARIG
jgi:hypothetical protein